MSLLRLADGGAALSLSPERATALGLAQGAHVTTEQLGEFLASKAITLNDPDHLFYLSVEEQERVVERATPEGSRQLTEADREAFARFTRAAPEDDLDEAFVELDHWIVYGTFVGSEIAAAASMIPWEGTRLADLGVITLPEHRGRGLARQTVLALSKAALSRGYEPQYRCQLNNAPSVALAHSSGFSRLGQWEVITEPAT